MKISPWWNSRGRGAVLFLFAGILFTAQSCTKPTDATSDDAPAAKNGGGGGKKGRGGRGRGDFGPAPVVVTKVTRKDVPLEITSIGYVEAYSTVNVTAQISGQLTDVYFHEGDYVRKGTKLFQIDPRPIQAQVLQAEANLARDTAQAAQAEANLSKDIANEKYARDQATRYNRLLEEGVVSKQQGEQLESTADAMAESVKADRASIDSAKSQVKADEANIANLKVQLGYTTIYAPIEGKTGNLMIKAGNIVNANQTNLISITQNEPIYVTFSVPEKHLANVRRYMSEGKLSVTATPQNGSTETVHGQLTFVDNNVDVTTGTIKLKGTFRDPNHVLWPGGYANVTLRLAMQQDALVLPNGAVQSGQDGPYVYVVKDDQTVEMRPVTTGTRVGEDLVVEKGLDAGETVVAEGQLRLAPGSRVIIGGPDGPTGNFGGRGGNFGGRGRGGKGGFNFKKKTED